MSWSPAGLALAVLALAGMILVVGPVLRRAWKYVLLAVGLTQPVRIRLQEDTRRAWIQKPKVRILLEDLQRLGFRDARAYTVDEIPGIRLAAAFRKDQSLTAVVYRHWLIGAWADIVIIYEDGSGLTVCSAPTGGEIDHPPEHVKIFRKGARCSDLHREILAKAQSKPKRVVDRRNFAEVFEEAYRKEMEWRAARGGTTEQEVRRVAENMPATFDEDQIRDATARIKSTEKDWY